MKNNASSCKIYLVRHGQTEFNRDHLNMGHSDSPLTEAGIEEAQDVGEELKGIPFAAVYTSDLGRTIATAQLILTGKDVPSIQLPELRERSFGELEGKPEELWKSLRANHREEYEALPFEEKWAYKYATYVESDLELFTRVKSALDSIVAAHPGENVLVVTSSGPIRMSLIGLGFFTLETLPMGSFKHGAYAKLQASEGKFELEGIYGKGIDVVKTTSE